MNPLIKELASKALKQPDTDNDGLTVFDNDELEKFAELIVKECIEKKEALAQPEQEPVAWVWRAFDPDVGHYGEWSSWKLSDYKPPRQPSQWFQVVSLPSSTPPHRKPLTGWQPIETAPRDGTEILMTNGVDVSSGQWFSEYGGTYDQEGAPNGDERDAGWMDWIGGMQPDPTHWMPLPPPPTEAAHGIKE